MWQPEPGWLPLPGGTGTSTVGVWRTVLGGRPVVVKRLGAPDRRTTRPELSDPRHFAYWRRAADVVTARARRSTRRRGCGRPADLGRGGRRGDHAGPGLGRGRRQQRAVLRARARPVRGRRPGRPPVAGAATSCATGWRGSSAAAAGRPWPGPPSRTSPTTSGGAATRLLDELDALPQVPQHGDPAPANLPGRDGDDVLAIDWGTPGPRAGRRRPRATTCWARARSSSRCSTPTCSASPTGWRPATQAAQGARVTAVLTALSRAEWALARVAGGEGALAGKYRHPAVAPYLRSLQRQFPQIEELVGA